MTRFQQTGFAGAGQRTRVGRIPRLSTNVPVATPGQTITPPDAPQSKFLQLAAAFSIGVNTAANVIGDIGARRKQEREGEARQKFQEVLPLVQEQIANGDFEITGDSDTIEMARSLAAEYHEDDDTFNGAFDRNFVPQVNRALVGVRMEREASERQDQIVRHRDALMGGGGFSEVYTAARESNPQLSDSQLDNAIARPVLEAAANIGDTSTFDRIADGLGTRMATTVASLRARLENNVAAGKQQAKRDAAAAFNETMIDMIDNGADPAAVREVVKLADDDPLLDPSTVARARTQLEAHTQKLQHQAITDSLQSGITPRRLSTRMAIMGMSKEQIRSTVDEQARSMITAAAVTNDIDEMKRLSKYLNNSPESRSFMAQQTARAEQTILNRSQDDSRIEMTQDALFSNDPVTTASEIARRAQLDRTSPDFIDPATASGLLNTLGTRSTIDIQSEIWAQRLSSGVTPPAASGDDNALIAAMQMQGVVTATRNNNGTPRLDQIINPFALGVNVATTRRVPTQIRDRIDSGLGSPDASQVIEASKAYAAIYMNDRELALAMDIKGTAGVRAMALASRMDEIGPEKFMSLDTIEQRVPQLAGEIMNLTTQDANITRTQSLGLIHDIDSAMSIEPFAVQAMSGAANELERQLESRGFDASRSEMRIRTLTNRFNDVAVREMNLAMARGLSQEQAIDVARERAGIITIRESAPFRWNGTVYLQERGAIFSPSLEDELLERMNADGWPDTLVELVQENAVPVYVASRNAYLFRRTDRDGQFVEWDGGFPMIDLNKDMMTAGEQALIDKIEAEKKRQQLLNFDFKQHVGF